MFLIVQDGAIKMSAKLISFVKPLVLKKGKNPLVLKTGKDGIVPVRGGHHDFRFGRKRYVFLIVQDGAIKMSAKLISYVKPLVLKKGKNGRAWVRVGQRDFRCGGNRYVFLIVQDRSN